ncbi:MAG: Na/Pi cotransporter family protein [Pirellulales bacterium]|nr:Na/Pi cotransporter family protein [Pirellulales bacterium]
MLALTVIGGLGIFLLGMKNMSEGLQAVAGAGLRRMISAVTDNRLMATGVGCLVTMLIQSSSITTVMVVGFVNSGFMTLSQAIGVIMGANIGTTITGWILALKIGKYGLPMLGAAAFAYLFSRRDRVHFVAMAVMGLGMVFFGLELMKDGFSIVKDLPAFEAWFATFAADTYFGVLKCAVVGCAVTFIVQSSSATLGITISLAVTGVISVQTAGALVLGENIGTTITAFLASFGATVNAKRAAYYHMVFNIMGVAWITAIFVPFYFPFIQWFVENSVDVLPGIGDGPEATIAMTHSIFNIANTILFLPFVQVFARLLQRVVPQRAKEEKPHLTSLDIRMLETSAIAIEQSRVEVLRMANGCNKMAGWLREILTQDVPDQKIVQKTFHREEVLDAVQDEIVAFMAHLLSGNISLEVSEEARRQVRMADEYESVSDYLANVLKSHLKLEQAGLRFSQDDMDKLLQLHDMVAEYLDMIGTACRQRVPEIITKAHSQGHAITLRVKELRERFLRKMSEERLDAQLIVAYTAQLNAYRRVREHVLNIAEALAGEK